jgi:hypothetical protein
MRPFTTDSGVRWQSIGIGQTRRKQRPRFLSGSQRQQWQCVPTAMEGRLGHPVHITRWGWATKWIDQQWYNPKRRRHCLTPQLIK